MDLWWFAAVVLLAPMTATAIPVSFSGEFGADAPSTGFTASNTFFAFSFDAPATLDQLPVLKSVQYTFGGQTRTQTAMLSAVDNGGGTNALNVLVFEKYLGVDFNLTAPAFLSGGVLIAGSYQPTSASGTANIAGLPSIVPFSIGQSSPLIIGAAAPVPEPETWALLGLGFVFTGVAVRRGAAGSAH